MAHLQTYASPQFCVCLQVRPVLNTLGDYCFKLQAAPALTAVVGFDFQSDPD